MNSKRTFPTPGYCKAGFHGLRRCLAQDQAQILEQSSLVRKQFKYLTHQLAGVEAIHLHQRSIFTECR
jgi:hypothetical protein